MKLKRGDVREDGMVFRGYRKYKGEIKENWTTRELFEKYVLAVRRSYENWKDSNYGNWKDSNLGKVKAASKAWRARNPVKSKESSRAWRARNPGKSTAAVKAWRVRNPESAKAARQRWLNKKPMRKVIVSCRSRVSMALSGKKTKSTLKYIGCSWVELSTHLESKFQLGMTWENYGRHGWHVDHIIPLASANSFDELIPLLHYTNLQPLWALDNLRKSDKMPNA